MALITFSMIYLGNSVDLDPAEGNSSVENVDGLIGTYFGSGDPAYQYITTVTSNDANNDATIHGDGFGVGEEVSYDVGSGTVITVLDFAATVNLNVSFVPSSGEPDYVGVGGIIQTAVDDLFLVMLDDDFGLGANSLDDVPIESIAVTFVQSSGQNQAAAASDDQEFVTCFVRGTDIQTSLGPVSVERLQVGDFVQTVENGFQPIRWIAKSVVHACQIEKNLKIRPVCISAGALGHGLPSRNLLVSRQHRMLASSPIVDKMFDCSEIFITAVKLTTLPGIFVDNSVCPVEYFHILLDEHEVIFAENAPTESFYTGPFALNSLSGDVREELRTLFPELVGVTSFNRLRLPTPNNKKQKTKRICHSLRKKPDTGSRIFFGHQIVLEQNASNTRT